MCTGKKKGGGLRIATRPRRSGSRLKWSETKMVVSWPFRLDDHQPSCRWRRFCLWALQR